MTEVEEFQDHEYLCGPRLSFAERISLAEKRNDDVLVAAIDDGYGTRVIRNMSAPAIAAEIRSLAPEAKSGNVEARKTLRCLLQIHLSDFFENPAAAFLNGILESTELSH